MGNTTGRQVVVRMKKVHRAEWSKLNWDLSWSEKMKIADVLPNIGTTYIIRTDAWVAPTKEQSVDIVWRPPHSELNGWSDRPYEIQRSYLIRGLLQQREPWDGMFKFLVTEVTKLNQVMESTEVSDCKHLPRLLDDHNWRMWSKNIHSRCYSTDRMDYISVSVPDQSLDVFIEKKKSDAYLVYMSECCDGDEEEYLLREKLDSQQYESVKRAIALSTPILIDKIELQDDEIQGVKWQ